MYVTLAAHLGVDESHFKGAVDTCSPPVVPLWTAQLCGPPWVLSAWTPEAQPGAGAEGAGGTNEWRRDVELMDEAMSVGRDDQVQAEGGELVTKGVSQPVPCL